MNVIDDKDEKVNTAYTQGYFVMKNVNNEHERLL